MRHHEFELTEDELFELKMSPSNLARMAKNIDARVGMEFELIIPGYRDEEGGYSEPDYDMDESFPTGPGWERDVISFFQGGSMGGSRQEIQRAIDSLNEDFWNWMGDQEQEYISSIEGQDRAFEIAADNVDQADYESDEEHVKAVYQYLEDNEDSVREQVGDEFREETDLKFEEWLDDQDIRSMSQFGDLYGLDWPYWTLPDEGGDIDVDSVADDFSDAIGAPVTASSSYHGARREPGKWVVEPDGSLQGDDGEGGLEFVSPPLTIPEMLASIDKVAKWAGRVGAYTNKSTGLHMNVSVPDQQNLDYVKLAMFLGDDYILEQFGREGNTYAKSTLKKIKTQAATNPDRVEEMLRQFQGGLNQLASKIIHTGSTDKYTSINNRGGWIEFRGPGGDWLGEYAAGENKVTNTVLRAVVALDVATKPDAFKQEYYKKLYKTLNPKGDEDAIQYFAKYAAGELPQSALKSFIRQIQTQRAVKKQKPGDAPLPSRDQRFAGYWEIVNRNTDQIVHFFSANNMEDPRSVAEAERIAAAWQQQTGFNDPYYVRPLMRANDNASPTTTQPVAGSTQSLQRQRLAAQMPRLELQDGNWEIYSITSNNTVYRFAANTEEEAVRAFNIWQDAVRDPSLPREVFNLRTVQPRSVSTLQQQAQGTGSLPPGNQRWLVLDRNDNEVYSFVNTTAQSDANQYARDWMINRAPREVRDNGPFTIVPAR